MRRVVFLMIPILFYSCSSISNRYQQNTETNTSSNSNFKIITSDRPFEPSFDLRTFFNNNFLEFDEKRINYLMTVKIGVNQSYRNDGEPYKTIIYDYRPKKVQDFQVIVTTVIDVDGNLFKIKLEIFRQATMKETAKRLALFKTFDEIEKIIASIYNDPWYSTNAMIKNSSTDKEDAYNKWLTIGESMIEEGNYQSRWYTLKTKDGLNIDLMSLKLEPNLVFEMYPAFINEKLKTNPL